MASPGTHRAVAWLAAVSPDPAGCRWAWERGGPRVVMLPAGRRWDVLVLPGELGRPALAVLARGIGILPAGPVPPGPVPPGPVPPGPVLAEAGGQRLAFLVPAGTAARWVGTGVRALGEGAWIAVPHPACGPEAGDGPHWLLPPDGSGRLTDPARLELAMHAVAAGLVDPGPDGRAR